MERIDDMTFLVNNHTGVQVFGEQGCAFGQQCGRDDQAVPEGEVVSFSYIGRFKVSRRAV
jgi:hypothetical protein